MPRRKKISRPRERGRQPVSHPRDLYYPPEPAEVASATALDSLTDVNLGSVSDDDLLVYDSGTGAWVSRALVAGDIPSHSHNLSDLGDVDQVPSPTTNDILRWNGTEWEHVLIGTALENGFIFQLSDVYEFMSPGAGDVLAWNDGASRWQNYELELNLLTDMTIVSPAEGHVLYYDYAGGTWRNYDLATAGIAADDHTHAAADITSGTFADARISESSVTQHVGSFTLSGLGDVDQVPSPAANDILRWNGTEWEHVLIGTALENGFIFQLSDVYDFMSPDAGDVLAWNDGASRWQNYELELSLLTDMSINVLTDEHVLAYDSAGGTWRNYSRAGAGLAGLDDDNDMTGLNDFSGGVTLSERSDLNSKGETDMQRHYGPGLSISQGTITGSLAIKVPSTTSTMHAIRVTIYEYDNSSGAVELLLGGYAYTATNAWLNTSAGAWGGYISGSDAYGKYGSVRFVYDSGGDGFRILIGDSATVWNYPKIFVEDLQGHNLKAAPTLGFYETGVNAEPTWEDTVTEYVNRSGHVKNITSSTATPTGEVPYGTLHLIY